MNNLILTGLIALAISYDVLAEKCPDGWGSNGQWEPVDGLCYRNAGNYGRNHWDESIKVIFTFAMLVHSHSLTTWGCVNVFIFYPCPPLRLTFRLRVVGCAL